MKYLFLLLFSASAMAEEWKYSTGIGYLPDHPDSYIAGVKRDWKRNYITADIICYKVDKCRPMIGVGKYLIKDRDLPLLSDVEWLSYYLSFGVELTPSTKMMGTVLGFSTKVGLNVGRCAVEVRHLSNAAAVLAPIFGDQMLPNQGHNSISLICGIKL